MQPEVLMLRHSRTSPGKLLESYLGLLADVLGLERPAARMELGQKVSKLRTLGCARAPPKIRRSDWWTASYGPLWNVSKTNRDRGLCAMCCRAEVRSNTVEPRNFSLVPIDCACGERVRSPRCFVCAAKGGRLRAAKAQILCTEWTASG